MMMMLLLLSRLGCPAKCKPLFVSYLYTYLVKNGTNAISTTDHSKKVYIVQMSGSEAEYVKERIALWRYVPLLNNLIIIIIISSSRSFLAVATEEGFMSSSNE